MHSRGQPPPRTPWTLFKPESMDSSAPKAPAEPLEAPITPILDNRAQASRKWCWCQILILTAKHLLRPQVLARRDREVRALITSTETMLSEPAFEVAVCVS